MHFTPEHEQIRDTVRKFVANEINPFTKEWEKAGIFPAHQLFKKMGDLGLLGIKYPTEFGGMGLDFSYSMVMAEALGDCNVGGVPMAIGVQTDMCTPALARFGSDDLLDQSGALMGGATSDGSNTRVNYNFQRLIGRIDHEPVVRHFMRLGGKGLHQSFL